MLASASIGFPGRASVDEQPCVQGPAPRWIEVGPSEAEMTWTFASLSGTAPRVAVKLAATGRTEPKIPIAGTRRCLIKLRTTRYEAEPRPGRIRRPEAETQRRLSRHRSPKPAQPARSFAQLRLDIPIRPC